MLHFYGKCYSQTLQNDVSFYIISSVACTVGSLLFVGEQCWTAKTFVWIKFTGKIQGITYWTIVCQIWSLMLGKSCFLFRSKKIMHHPSLSDIGSQRQIFVHTLKAKVVVILVISFINSFTLQYCIYMYMLFYICIL